MFYTVGKSAFLYCTAINPTVRRSFPKFELDAGGLYHEMEAINRPQEINTKNK